MDVKESEDSQELLFLWRCLLNGLFKCLLLLQVHLIPTHLISLVVAIQGELQLIQSLVAVSPPRIRKSEPVINFQCFFEAAQSLFDSARSQISRSFIMVVYCIIGLELDHFVVAVDSLVVVFQSIVRGSQIPVVGSHFRVELDGIFDKLNFLIVASQLSCGFSLQMPKLALLAEVQPDVAASDDILPPLQAHVGIGLDQIGFLVILEGVGELQDAFVVFLLLQSLDVLENLFGGVFVYGLAIIPNIELKLLICHWYYKPPSLSCLIKQISHRDFYNN